MEFELNNILRENIKNLTPYSSARSEYKGSEGIFLDANENSFGAAVTVKEFISIDLNRYPDPMQIALKKKISELKGISVERIFLGNGSDEAIDILFRVFCEPRKDNAIVCPPTYGMYEVSANINNVGVIKVPLIAETFQLDTEAVINTITQNTKLIFICCPNNPTGNGVKWLAIKKILENFKGIVVIDEAYIDFASYRSLIPELSNYPNLVIIQTFSKAWGLAGLRVGMAFASTQIIEVFNKIKPPYNINSVSQKLVLDVLNNSDPVNSSIKEIVSERNKLNEALIKLPFVLKVYLSEANFLLVKTTNANSIYDHLLKNKVIVRKRNTIILCEDCLRITIGTKEENEFLLNTLINYKK